jgi:hypothetical protein
MDVACAMGQAKHLKRWHFSFFLCSSHEIHGVPAIKNVRLIYVIMSFSWPFSVSVGLGPDSFMSMAA